MKIKTYKGIDINYNEDNGQLDFEFEGERSMVKYIFEAKQIIDEPVWESCDLQGYFIDGTFNDFIGKSKAIKKNIKNGKPYWKNKGRYDREYKDRDWSDRNAEVYLNNDHNDKVYKEFIDQENVVNTEKIKLKNIIGKLTN